MENQDQQVNSSPTTTSPVTTPVKSKSKVSLIFGGILLLLLVGGGAYYLGTQNNRTTSQTQNINTQPTTNPQSNTVTNPKDTPIATQSPQTDETANWKTYTNNILSFKYPESFSIKSQSDSKVLFIQSEEPFKGSPFLEVSINNTLNYQKIRQCKVQPNYYENDEGDCYVQFKQTQISKIDGYKYLFTPKGASHSIVVFETAASPYVEFKFYCYGGGCDNSLTQIVSTLELKR